MQITDAAQAHYACAKKNGKLDSFCVKPNAVRTIGINSNPARSSNSRQRACPTARHDSEKFIQAVLAGGRGGVNEVKSAFLPASVPSKLSIAK